MKYEKPIKCQKCGGDMAGPRYRQESLKGERLVYTCLTCGYEHETPCRDAAEKAERLFRP